MCFNLPNAFHPTLFPFYVVVHILESKSSISKPHRDPYGRGQEETCPARARMYLAIELWQENGLSQVKFCTRENLSVKTFSYWYRKYKKEKGFLAEVTKEIPDTFIPVEVSGDRMT